MNQQKQNHRLRTDSSLNSCNVSSQRKRITTHRQSEVKKPQVGPQWAHPKTRIKHQRTNEFYVSVIIKTES